MRQVRIKRMHIENFKGLKLFDLEFDNSITRIVGANGTGKTTLHDAYLWLLTGMDSSNRAKFFVQPLDESSRTIDHLTTTVSATFDFGENGVHEYTRSLSQVWTRKRGTKEDVLNGSESKYFIDNVPYKATEFSEAVSKNFCSLSNFELISSIKAFGKLDMKAKREKLIQMAGQMPEILNATDYPKLWQYYSTTKNVESIKKQILYEMNGLKNKQQAIPIKITENERNLPEGIDFKAIREKIANTESAIERIDAQLEKDAFSRDIRFSGVKKLNDDLVRLNSELYDIQNSLIRERDKKVSEIKEAVSSANIAVTECKMKIETQRDCISTFDDIVSKYVARRDELRQQWTEKNEETWPDSIELECPTCHRPYDKDKIVEMKNAAIKSFNQGKVAVLDRIAKEGNEIVKKIEENKSLLESAKERLASLEKDLDIANASLEIAKKKEAELPSLETLIAANQEYQKVNAEKDALKVRIAQETPEEDENDVQLRNQRESLKSELSALYKELAKEDDIAKVEKRRNELEAENTELACKIADLDGVLYEISCYQKAYITAVEDKVSSMFKLVRWKMYAKNVTNDGEMEICECLVNGVPVSTNVNTAGGINAGIDIINALSKWLDVSMPLWIDGKESVTELLDTDAQLITLSVKENASLSIA